MADRGVEARLERLEERAKCVSPRAYARRLRALAKHLRGARGQPSPGLALHRSEARAVLFQLEALARFHREAIDDGAFVPLHAAFKSLEDVLGAVDFSDAIARRFGTGDVAVRAYFTGRRAEACVAVVHRLEDDGWWAEGDATPPRLAALLDALDDVRWPRPRKERDRARDYFTDCAKRLDKRLAANEFDFQQLETGVHEVRRRVRWLSILPAALDGLFVRDEAEPMGKPLDWYRKKEIVASPFNAFPRRDDVPKPLLLDSPAFLALSWYIAELGAWKDRGQVGDALVQAGLDVGLEQKTARARAASVLGTTLVTHAEVARAVEEATKRFQRDRVLRRLGAIGEG
jgi:hypothetical protein